MTASKAWAALVTTFVMPYLAQYGIGPETTLEQFLVIIGGRYQRTNRLLRPEQASNRITMRRLVRPVFWISLYLYVLLRPAVEYLGR